MKKLIEELKNDPKYEGLDFDRIYRYDEKDESHKPVKLGASGFYDVKRDIIVIDDVSKRVIVHEAIHRRVHRDGYDHERPHGHYFQCLCVVYGLNPAENVSIEYDEHILFPIQILAAFSKYGLKLTKKMKKFIKNEWKHNRDSYVRESLIKLARVRNFDELMPSRDFIITTLVGEKTGWKLLKRAWRCMSIFELDVPLIPYNELPKDAVATAVWGDGHVAFITKHGEWGVIV